jgi:hypothetical protein
MVLLDIMSIVEKVMEKVIKHISPMEALLLLVVGALMYFIYYKDKEVKELNAYIRESEKGNLQVLNEINNTLDKITETDKIRSESLIDEFKSLRDLITFNMMNKK